MNAQNLVKLKQPRNLFESRVEEWSYREKHYIMTMMGTRPTDNWEYLMDQSEITDEELRSNVPATRFYDGARWIHEEIVKPLPDQELVFLTIYGPSIWKISGTLKQLYEKEKTVFRGRQLGAISMWLGQYQIKRTGNIAEIEVGSVAPPVVKREEKKECVFPIISSPLLRDVRWFQGSGEVRARYQWCDVEYQIMSKPKSNIEVSVPDEVKSAWQTTAYQRKGVEDLLSLDYYNSNFSSYTAWSFECHERQIKTVLAAIPTSTRVVAPGDGWGVAKQALKGRDVLSTDIVRGQDYTESLEKTLDRLQAGDVLLLSYLWNLVTPEAKNRIKSLPNEVVIIDSYPFLTGWMRVGEGIFVNRKVNWITSQGLALTPEGFHEQAIAFTENLLRVENPSDLVRSNAYFYYKSMRPLAKFSSQGLPLCSTIEEAKRLGRPVYLAPIGGLYSKPTPTTCALGTKWKIRVVYEILLSQIDHRVVDLIRRKSHWYLDKDVLLFCFSFPATVPIKCRTPTEYLDYTVEVVQEVKDEDYSFTLSSITKTHLVWISQSPQPVIWKRTPFSEWCAYQYLSGYGKSIRGWRNAIFGKDYVSKPSMDRWEEHLSQFTIDRGPIPSLGPLRFDDTWWTHQQCELEIEEAGIILFPRHAKVADVQAQLIDLYGKVPLFPSNYDTLGDIVMAQGLGPIHVPLEAVETPPMKDGADALVQGALEEIKRRFK